MKKIFRSVLGLLTATASGLPLMAADVQPRLVVGIHVNELNADYLDWFRSGYGENGLLKMLQSGQFVRNVVYGTARPDHASACASFSTGSDVREHGIVSERWFDRTTGETVSCIHDPRYLGNYTQSTVSPAHLKAATLGDALKEASDGQSKVFVIGIEAEESVLLGGHAADGIFWLDETSGKWCTSTWYNYMPWWLQNINDRSDMGQRVESASWTPLKSLEHYNCMPYQQPPTLFQLFLGKLGNNRFGRYMESPMMNTEVAKLAAETIEKEQLGRDDATDYLMLQLSATPRLEDKALSAMELQDIYFRLDQDIAQLMEKVERQVGNDRVVFYLTGTGTGQAPAVDVPVTKAWTGDFYPDRCSSLLNLYLMALYGNDQYVSGWYRQEVFLNRARIAERGLDYDAVSLKAAEFLAEFSGVRRVYRYQEQLLNERPATSPEINAFYPGRSGDLYLDLQPGWNVRETSNGADYQVRSGLFSTPFLLWRPDQKAKTIGTPVFVGDIAATLSRIFRIRPPNACQGFALPEME